ncbi:protein disulfide-isomerase A6 [Pseudohyphozyma bogoriensis]|nr:protein disulfide-isomerase A6 [Pseudohyphozyma bogoriensis]
MKISSFVAVPLLATLVAAGLEDAKYSTVLTASNFKKEIKTPSVGTLTAFFAPWCGHCKNLESTWTKVAMAFDGDDRCRVAHLDADNGDNRPIAQEYGVSGYPTLKFIYSNGKPALTYSGARSEEALLQYLNENCGTAKLPGGRLSDLAGRIPSLDKLASSFFGPAASRKALYEKAVELTEHLKSESEALASYYVKIMAKYVESAEGAQEWIKKETERLGKLGARKGAVAGKKLDELKMKQNILAAFTYVKEAAEDVVDHIKGEL